MNTTPARSSARRHLCSGNILGWVMPWKSPARECPQAGAGAAGRPSALLLRGRCNQPISASTAGNDIARHSERAPCAVPPPLSLAALLASVAAETPITRQAPSKHDSACPSTVVEGGRAVQRFRRRGPRRGPRGSSAMVRVSSGCTRSRPSDLGQVRQRDAPQ
jgi:hypothetical protein